MSLSEIAQETLVLALVGLARHAHASASAFQFTTHHPLLDVAAPQHRRNEPGEELEEQHTAPDASDPLDPPAATGQL